MQNDVNDNNDDVVTSVAPEDENVPSSGVPGYDLDEAMKTPGGLIDTHCHLDFICRKLRWQVKLDSCSFWVQFRISIIFFVY